MKHIHIASRLVLLASAICLPAQNGFGQNASAPANIPQPHLEKALAEAFQERTWKYPALLQCYGGEAGAAEQVLMDPGPVKVADNFYFLGMGWVSAWALDTSDGIIVIDSLNNSLEVDKYIIGGLRTLGLDPSRIKMVIVSHGHGDHFGGATELQNKYHARVYMSAIDWPFAEAQAKAPGTQLKGQGPAPKRDVEVKDGDSVTLGDATIKMLVTPGHTPGSLSLIIPVKDKGVSRKLLFLGGVTAPRRNPPMQAAYDQWTTRLQQIASAEKVDGMIGNHASFDEAITKIAKIKANPDRPDPFFTGTESVLRYLRVLHECNLNSQDLDRAQAGAR
jgi:metallo-beta-lactamase class B